MSKLLGLPERRWLKLALALNFQPASYLHESWYASLSQGELIQQLRNVPVSAAPISRHLRQTLTLDRDLHDFSSRRARLALLDGPALAQLSLYLGLALRSESLRNEMLGERLRSLRQALGDDAFTFALKRAPFLGAIPRFPFEPEDDSPHTRFSMIGARYCVLHVAELSEGLARRMVLKLPQTWAGWISPQNAPPDNTPNNARNVSDLPPLLRKLIKERLPQWHLLFA